MSDAVQPSATSALVMVVQIAADDAKPWTNTIGSCFTFTATVAVFPSTDAVIVAVPKWIDVMTPDVFTIATVVSLELQATVRSVRTFPFASFVVGVICRLSPAYSLRSVESTLMVATAAGVTGVTGVGLLE